MSTLLFRTIVNNPRNHPVSLALLHLYCPAAAYWWNAGVEIEPPFDPMWAAIEDYAGKPPRTLREYLEERGLESIIDEAKKYVEQVKTARQRLPYIDGPELLPTFSGGKLPLRTRFGINEELAAIGGADGFFSYVRTWAFLIPDWLAKLPFGDLYIEPIWASVRFEGLRSAYQMPAWAVFPNSGGRTPYVLGVPPTNINLSAMVTLYLFAQSPSKPWEHEPQVWQLSLAGTAAPVDPPIASREAASAVLWLGKRAGKKPFPLASLTSPQQCATCVFYNLCVDKKSRQWTPQVATVFGEQA